VRHFAGGNIASIIEPQRDQTSLRNAAWAATLAISWKGMVCSGSLGHYFFSRPQPIGGRDSPPIALSAVHTMAMINKTGENMVERCENGILSLVSAGNNGGTYA
jgi:hypothetical protein